MSDLILARWEHEARADGVRTILPDGCRDVILVVEASGRVRLSASPLMTAPTPVALQAGTTYRGFRLVPGARIDERALRAHARALCADADGLARGLPLVAGLSPGLAEALAALREARDVSRAARACGIAPRTLQRLVRLESGRTPLFWLRLARARRAARAVVAGEPLAAIAADHGLSDQAHLTREIARLTGVTPSRLAGHEDIRAQLAGPGYDVGATGVQISTRKPSGSRT